MSKKEVAGANVMCTSDSGYGQPNVRAPLKSLPTSTTSTGRSGMDTGKMKPTSNPLGHPHWSYPANFNGETQETAPPMSANGSTPVESFEMEDTTTGSGGTSWTLRMPWLRNKRKKNWRQDDENSSIRTVQTLQSRYMPKPAIHGSNDDQSSHYYGGLMKTTSPTFVSVGSGSIETLDGDGLYRTTRDSQAGSLVLHQQHRKPEQATSTTRRSTMTVSPSQTPRASPLDQNLLPQHNSLHPLPTPASLSGGQSRPQHFFLGEESTSHLQPKNNNKVFRNRSWISTSSRESNGAKSNDSLADFDEAEWTPQDSAYGAAIPICGFVPKRLRQGIEATIIALFAFLLVYLVVTTSISISESKGSGKHVSTNNTNSGNKNYDNGLDFDDDWYVEYSQYQNDKDDYFNDDQYAENRNGDGGNDNDNNGG